MPCGYYLVLLNSESRTPKGIRILPRCPSARSSSPPAASSSLASGSASRVGSSPPFLLQPLRTRIPYSERYTNLEVYESRRPPKIGVRANASCTYDLGRPHCRQKCTSSFGKLDSKHGTSDHLLVQENRFRGDKKIGLKIFFRKKTSKS